ncbi:hypothetical protein BDF19DRAFT_449970 [Syncephalis fuscata]|nr:hypothetical protein BDF19DRAFT_449970 [Syncephalis fuscata]
MCGRTELGVDVESIQARFHLYRWLHPEQFRPNYNVAPTQTQPTLIWDSQSGERLIQNMQWGITKYNQKAIIINIRDDTIRSKPIVGEKYKRCVVLARGYYEWKHQDKHRIPYYIHRADQSIMLLAGLYTETLNNDEINYTYVIVTTNAANDISGLHERMPVVLDDPSEWLSGQKDWLKKLCPFDGQLAW